MDIKEKEAIERQFERNLDLLVRKKFPLTATAIVAAEQPMILLFKELIHRIEKREFELDKKDKIIELMARAIGNYDSQLDINTFKNKEHIIEYFTEYATEGE